MAVSPIEQVAINTIRTLSIDSIERANSGHPGLPMGAAPMAYTLWTRVMRHNPHNPGWFNRDRFVLSAGHGSMLLYSLLHLMDYGLTLDDLKQFRQLGSRTPGHPEYRHTPGVETTTGPLGQGIANAVGMAMAERSLAARYNRPGLSVIDHHTYAICGDGDLMEGVSNEAASLAGHLKLDRLVVLYDSNDISLDGPTSNAFTEDVAARFEALGWNVLRVADGNDVEQIANALTQAQKSTGHPTLIEVRTIIGYGSPGRQGTSEAHGKPLGADESRLARETYGWTYPGAHYVPDEVRTHFAGFVREGERHEADWNALLARYRAEYPELAAELLAVAQGRLPEGWDAELPSYPVGAKAIATRQASGQALNALAKQIPTLFGGSADLAGSNDTTIKGADIFSPQNYSGRNVWFGVREHGMGGALNGMALHGGLHVFGGTFLVFSDYMRPSVRLASLMSLPIVYVFTHDSIGLGSDGPTHQPVEHIPSLRLIPNLIVIRPADANETVAAWRFAMAHRDRPVALALSRQALPILAATPEGAVSGVEHGAYVVVREQGSKPDVILIGTGSEVSLCVSAQEALLAKGIQARVVSMPATRLFEEQSQAYRDEVLPPSIRARVAVEMAQPTGWERHTGLTGEVLGITTFGASGSEADLMKQFGFTAESVAAAAQRTIERSKQS